MIKLANNIQALITKLAVSSEESIVDVPIRCTPGFGCKRYFTDQERSDIDAAQAKIMPYIFNSNADPVHTLMSSPSWAGLGTGALGAVAGALGGAGIGAGTHNNIALSAVLGGLLGGTGGMLYGSHSRGMKNKELENTILNMPVGADIGDIETFTDPQLKQQLARDFQRQLMRKGLI
jgi:hypothetical protein